MVGQEKNTKETMLKIGFSEVLISRDGTNFITKATKCNGFDFEDTNKFIKKYRIIQKI